MPTYIDTHAHLTRKEFDSDLAAAVKRAEEQQVETLTVATCLATSRACLDVAERFSSVYAAVGIHPTDVREAGEGDMAEIADLCKHEKVVAIGETGLDYYWDFSTPEEQKPYLEQHIELARTTGLPLLLHARQSEEDLLDALEPFMAAGGKAVWHCFVSSKKQIQARMERAVEMGLYLGLGGMITFEDQKPLRRIVPKIPDRHLLLETDCPFLAPRPRDERGKRNEPARVVRIAEELAALRGITLEDAARITTRNAREFLGLGKSSLEEEAGKIAYPIRNSLYIALTNACNSSCTFCARNTSWVVKGHDIRLDHDPSTEEVLAAMGDFSTYDEVVFCGFGEPTLRLDVLKEVARAVKEKGQAVRLNTNGLANLHYERDIVPELKGLVDTVSISLNTADPCQFHKLCNPRFGHSSYQGVCEFTKACVAAGLRTICSAVDMPGIDMEAARRKAEELGAEFRARSFVDAG